MDHSRDLGKVGAQGLRGDPRGCRGDPDLVDLEEDRQEREVPRYRVRHKGPPGTRTGEPSSASRPLQERHRSRSPLPGPMADEAPPEARAKQARPDAAHLAFMSNELSVSPCKYWKDENAMAEVAIDLPQWSSSQRKEMMRDFSAFIVRQLKRQNTEVSERRMSDDEKADQSCHAERSEQLCGFLGIDLESG